MNIVLHLFRVWILLCLIDPGLSYAQCDLVATLFSQSVCLSDIASPGNGGGASDSINQEERVKREKIALMDKIRAVAAEHILSQESYNPTRQEVDVFEEFMARSVARKSRDEQEIVATAEQLLNSFEYDVRLRKSLENTIATFRQSIQLSERIAEEDKIRDEGMRKRIGAESLVGFKRQLRKSRRRSSELWVARWKMNKALYDKYGGRVIFQQAGIEPIDAYREYLKDIRQKGDLKILKAVYLDVFDEFERYLMMDHNYLSEPGDRLFERPYWETTDLEAIQRARIEQLRAIPHK